MRCECMPAVITTAAENEREREGGRQTASWLPAQLVPPPGGLHWGLVLCRSRLPVLPVKPGLSSRRIDDSDICQPVPSAGPRLARLGAGWQRLREQSASNPSATLNGLGLPERSPE